VATREQGDEQKLDHLFLPDDALLEASDDLVPRAGQLLHLHDVGGGAAGR
jgi:hypothetical protein